MSNRLLLPITLTLLAVLSVWLVSGIGPPAAPQPSSIEGRDFFMEQMISIEMNSAGQPRFHLQADHLDHYPLGMRTELKQPTLLVYQADGQHWLIQAAKANLANDNEVINLQQGVTLQRADAAAGLVIKTQFLTVLPADNIAKTNHAVSIEQGDSRIEGSGLLAELDSQTITLSQVRGHYEISAQ